MGEDPTALRKHRRPLTAGLARSSAPRYPVPTSYLPPGQQNQKALQNRGDTTGWSEASFAVWVGWY